MRTSKTCGWLICIIHLRISSPGNDTGVICMPPSALARLSAENAPAPDIIPDLPPGPSHCELIRTIVSGSVTLGQPLVLGTT
jgi:hypothetical protein